MKRERHQALIYAVVATRDSICNWDRAARLCKALRTLLYQESKKVDPPPHPGDPFRTNQTARHYHELRFERAWKAASVDA